MTRFKKPVEELAKEVEMLWNQGHQDALMWLAERAAEQGVAGYKKSLALGKCFYYGGCVLGASTTITNRYSRN